MGKGKRIALLIDVDNVKVSKDAINELMQKLENYGEVVYCKFYGYNDRKHLYLSDFITNYGYETAPFMRLKKRYSQLDNRIVVDAVRMNYTKPDIDTFCIVAGDGDLIPLLVELKSCGKTVIDVNTEYQELNTHMFDEHIYLSTINREAETYTPKSKKTEKVRKTQKTVAPKQVAKAAIKPQPTYVEEEDDEEEYVAPKRQNVQTSNQFVKPAPAVKSAPVVQPEPVEEEEDYDSFFEDDEEPAPAVSQPKQTTSDDLDNYIEDEYYDEPSGDYDLSEVLKDITARYNKLDFTNSDNMSEKLKLIRDIENLIESENSKGEGVYSDNEDIRQIFTDLQDVVDDMKNAL